MTQTNYAVAPGEYLKEWLDRGHPITDQQLADLLACSPAQATDLLQGRTPLTPYFANQLERITSIPATAWLRYETTYRADLERLKHHG